MVRSPGALLGYIAVGLLGLAVVLVCARLHAAVQVTSAGKAWLALLVAQLAVVARLGFSLATTAFTVDVYRAMAPVPVGPWWRPRPAPRPRSSPRGKRGRANTLPRRHADSPGGAAGR